MITKVVIPAAGLGTRFLPATKAQPKEMLPIVDKPIIQYVVEEAVKAGLTDILIITGRGKRAIEDHFDKSVELEQILREKGKLDVLAEIEKISDMADIHYVRQKEAKGLGHAIYCARKYVKDEPFAVLFGDDLVVSKEPAIKQLIPVYDEFQKAVAGLKRVPKEQVSKYGVFECDIIKDRTYKVKSIVEKPPVKEAKSDLVSIGRYILVPDIFDILKDLKPGVGNEIQLADAINELNKKSQVYGYEIDGQRFDAGDKLEYMEMSTKVALERNDIGPEFRKFLENIL